MVRWERHRRASSVLLGPRKQWVPKVRLLAADDAPASGVGEAAVAAGGVLGEAEVAAGGVLEEAAVAAGGADAAPTLQEAVRNPEFTCRLSSEEEEEVTQEVDDEISCKSASHFNAGDSVWAFSDTDGMV